jgi:hypothetical protein
VLRAASVFGEVCWEGGVATLLGGAMSATSVGEWLTRLVEQEALAARPKGRFPEERELTFRHALLREGAYASLTDEDKRRGHHLAGEWLEEHGEDDPMVLAGHFERGGDGTRAARYYLRASEQAFQVLDLAATVARAGLGLACGPPEPLRIELLGMRCGASNQGLHLVSATMADAEELIRTAPRGSIPWAQGVQTYFVGMLLAGRSAELPPSVAMLLDVTPAPDAVGRMALVYLNGIWTLDNLGHIRDGTRLEKWFFEVILSMGEKEPFARFWWDITVGMRGSYAHEDPWTALEHCEAIQEIFDETRSELIFLNMQLFRALNLWFLGSSSVAERLLEEIPGADEKLGVVSALRRFILAWVRADRGAFEQARAIATELRESGRAQRNPLEEARGAWVLAEVLRRMGDLDGAEREIPAAFGLELREPLDHPGVLATLAALRLAQGRVPEALAAAEEAAARTQAMGGCGTFRGAFVRLVRAEAQNASGDLDAARSAISEARERLIAIAAKVGDPDLRRSFLEDVPENKRTLALAREWLGDAAPSA